MKYILGLSTPRSGVLDLGKTLVSAAAYNRGCSTLVSSFGLWVWSLGRNHELSIFSSTETIPDHKSS